MVIYSDENNNSTIVGTLETYDIKQKSSKSYSFLLKQTGENYVYEVSGNNVKDETVNTFSKYRY